MLSRLLVAACVLTFAAGCAQSPSGSQTATGSATSSAAPQAFAEDAASMGMNEVALGQLAVERATSPEVRAFGRQMVQSHGRNNEQLKAAARQAGVSLPTRPQTDEIAKMDQLDDLTGPAFDRAFINQMVADHQEAVRLYEQQANQGNTPSLRTYAGQTLPHLREHLNEAQALAQRQRS